MKNGKFSFTHAHSEVCIAILITCIQYALFRRGGGGSIANHVACGIHDTYSTTRRPTRQVIGASTSRGNSINASINRKPSKSWAKKLASIPEIYR